MLRLFQRHAPEQAAHFDIAHDGETYRVALKHVATSRRFTLRVRTPTRDVLLTMPTRTSLKAAREFYARVTRQITLPTSFGSLTVFQSGTKVPRTKFWPRPG